MDGKLERHLFHDIDQFRAHLLTQDIEPIQLSMGRLNLGFASLAFDDMVITRLDCNRKVADRLCMDPSWLLLAVLLAPQRWGAYMAPADSLVVIAPGTEYRNSVPEGFRCVETAVRLDLADEIGLGPLCLLKGAPAIMPISAASARRAEHRVDLLLDQAATSGLAVISGEKADILREGCQDFLCFLRDTGLSLTRGLATAAKATGNEHFALAQDALQAIETSPVDEPPSVEFLAKALSTTRRTLLSAFQDTLGTSPSRYILARRLSRARRDINCGKSHSVTDAALEYGFTHFGRFAYHYRHPFGETPSTTLHRASVFPEHIIH
jgi:AraC-like DNA-binding protein